MRIHFERAGGLAAPALRRSVTVDTDQLPEDEAKQLVSLVSASGLADKTEGKGAGPGGTGDAGRDRYHYSLRVDSEGGQHTAEVSEANLAGPLRQLVGLLNKMARPGRA